MMEELIGMITKRLKKGQRVKIAGHGILQVCNRAQIKASKKVAFRATK